MRSLLHFLLLPALVGTLLVSCGDDATGPGGSGDVTTHYLPLSQGSTWEYEGLYSGLSILGDTTIDGTDYVVYAYKNQAHQYARREGTTTWGYSLQDEEEFVVLKEEEAGTTWTVTLTAPGGGAQTRASYTVVSYDDARIVNGFRYTDILHVGVTYESLISGGWVETGTSDQYLARGIGIIEQDYGAFFGDQKIKLVSFDVKGSSATAEEDSSGQNSIDGGMFDMKVNGTLWGPDEVSIVAENQSRITIDATKGNFALFHYINLDLFAFDVGTHTLAEETGRVAYFRSLNNRADATSGEWTITRNDAEMIEGTFRFTMDDGTEITDGVFAIEK